MNITVSNFFKSNFFTQRKYIISLWFLITIVSVVKQFMIGRINNYKIFTGVFYHTINKLTLYAEYPQEYFDHNHYGPVFSILIAPFALLPDYLGLPFWGLFNTLVLIWAVTKLPLKENQIVAILWICFHEFLTTLLGLQFNPLMTAIIILSFVFINKEQVFWAAMFIVLGIFIKLYGVVGLAFFFFTKNKLKFIGSLILWSIIFFILPMAISSPEYILQTYSDWFYDILNKNNENTGLTSYQDICLMGVIRRFLQDSSISNIPFLFGGVILFALQYLRFKVYNIEAFRLMLLASVLIFTVIFSTSSESPTYIIAFVGVAIWFVIQPKPITKLATFLLVFAIILTSLSPSDLMPTFLKENYIRPYALKALPCICIWIVLLYEMIMNNFNKYRSLNN